RDKRKKNDKSDAKLQEQLLAEKQALEQKMREQLEKEREKEKLERERLAKQIEELKQVAQTKGLDKKEAAEPALENKPLKDKWALIVGISKFQNPTLNLKYPSKDAKDFYDFLINDAKFSKDHVKLLVDEQATRANILSELGDKWLPRVAAPDDLVLIYISSHGSASDLDVGGVNYLLAHDTDPDSLYASGIPMQDLARIIKGRVHSDRVVVILDACHSGAADPESKGLVRAKNVNVDEVVAGTGQMVISSSQPNQVSWESKECPNSVFTRYLIDGLKKNNTLGEAFEYMKDKVQQTVLRERGVLQTPVMKSKWHGKDLPINSAPTDPRPGL
ncbi:MAG TPA: caspase family protein, partial [Candidatus Obscuribacterales bacterium]